MLTLQILTHWTLLDPPHTQQGPQDQDQGQDRRRRGNSVARVAEVAAAAAICEAGDGREHLGQARVITVSVPDTLTDRLPSCRHTEYTLSTHWVPLLTHTNTTHCVVEVLTSLTQRDTGVFIRALLHVLTASGVIRALITAKSRTWRKKKKKILK